MDLEVIGGSRHLQELGARRILDEQGHVPLRRIRPDHRLLRAHRVEQSPADPLQERLRLHAVPGVAVAAAHPLADPVGLFLKAQQVQHHERLAGVGGRERLDLFACRVRWHETLRQRYPVDRQRSGQYGDTPREMSAPDPSPQVLIAGAGPTGLLLASELERRGVPSLLVDALDAPRGWDRATVVHSRSMEIFEALGLAEPFLDQGVKTRAARFHSAGHVIGELNLELVDSRYPFDLGISEEVTESVLTAHLEQHGGSVTRSTKLVALEQRDEGVLVTLERDGESTQLEVPWVVGCDGLHSVVRDFIGVEFEGTDIAAPWAVFDAAVDGWDDEYDVAAAFLDTPTVILTPLPGHRWRVYQRPESDATDLVAGATEAVRRYKPRSSSWTSRIPPVSNVTPAWPRPSARDASCSPAMRPTRARRPRATG